MDNPQQLRYSKEHEWLSDAEGGVSTVGITEHAANALGDVVFVQLPRSGPPSPPASPAVSWSRPSRSATSTRP